MKALRMVAILVTLTFLAITLPSSNTPLLTASAPATQNAIPLKILAQVQTSAAQLGDEFTVLLDVANTAEWPLTHVRIQLPRVMDVAYLSSSDGRLTEHALEIGALAAGEVQQITLNARLEGMADAPEQMLTFTAQALEVDSAEAVATLPLSHPQPETASLAASESASMLDGRVTLQSPSTGQASGIVYTLNLREQHPLLSANQGTILRFDLSLERQGRPVHLDEPATVTIALDDLVDEQNADDVVGWMRANGDEEWQPLPTTYDPAAKTLTLSLEEGGEIKVGGGQGPENAPEVEYWEPSYVPPGVSEYTGAAQFSLSLEVPPGIGGLAPSLDLHYSSRGVDSLDDPVMSNGFGEGWSLPQAEIINGNASKMYAGVTGHSDYCHYSNNLYTLALNGTSFFLEPQPGVQRYGRYTAAGDPTLYIELKSDSSTNVTGEYWLVKTADGTEYTFGQGPDAEQVVTFLLDGCPSQGNSSQARNNRFVATNWKLERMLTPAGHEVRANYVTQCGKDSSGQCRKQDLDSGTPQSTEAAVAIDEIEYNFVNGDPQTVISYTYDLKNSDFLKRTEFMTVGFYRPREMKVKQKVGGSYTTVNRYEFYYYTDTHLYGGPNYEKEFWYIERIERFGLNDNSLPTYSFKYDHNSGACGQREVGSSEIACVYALTQVENGYGAVTKLTYDALAHGGGDWYFVSDVNTWDGTNHIYGGGAPAASITRYTPTNPCYDEGGGGCDTPNREDSHVLVGFANATVELGYASTNLTRREVDFNTADYWLNGRMTESRLFDPATGHLLVKETNTWQNVNKQAQLARRDTRIYEPGGAASYHTYETHTYHASYGGRYRTAEYVDDGGGGTLYRCSENVYGHKDTGGDWFINRPLRTTLYEGACGSNKQAETLYRYTGSANPSDTTLGAKAELAWTLQWAGGQTYVSERRLYYVTGPEAGLLKQVDTFADYSTTAAYAANVNSSVETTAYNALGLPLSTRVTAAGVAATHVTSISYETTRPWLPATTTDASGGVTSYVYDDFGRILEVRYPGETGAANVIYSYYDTQTYRDLGWLNGQPLLIGIWRKTDPAETTPWGAGGVWERRFYNGLGQLVQTQTAAENWQFGTSNGDDIVSYSVYDARGLAVAASVSVALPRYVSDGTNPYQDPAGFSAELNHTAYDALGRVTAVTAPDGSTTTTTYTIPGTWTNLVGGGVREEWVENAKNDIQVFIYDHFDRLAWVGQKDDGGPCDALQVTTYAYDVQDNLVQVSRGGTVCGGTYTAGPASAVTTMSYDPLGRKTSMDDPDMGSWTYNYGPANTLVSQLDAHGDKLCFAYDGLGRLTRKVQDDTPATGCPATPPASGPYHLASYTYDTAVNGVGQVHTASWGPEPTLNNGTFSYDGRGLPAQHTRQVDGRAYTLANMSYDAMNRPVAVTYPDGEVVTTAYNRQGLPESLAGTAAYVTDADYNARGQMTLLARGNQATTTYGYYGPTGTAGNSNYRLASALTEHQGVTLLHWTYGYDVAGNITQIDELDDLGGLVDRQTFTYDHLNRLDTAVAAGVAPYNHDYDYDILGNIETEVIDGTTLSFAYDGNGHGHAQPHAVTSMDDGATVYTFDYDPNGNMTSRNDESGSYNQTFDVENRLTAVADTDSGDLTQFFYDADGIRVKTVHPDGRIVYTPFPNYEEEVRGDGWLSAPTPALSLTTPDTPGWSLATGAQPGWAMATADDPGLLAAPLSYTDNWTATADAALPGTSVAQGAGIGSGRGSARALGLNNRASGTLASPVLYDLEQDSDYELSFWVKGAAAGIAEDAIRVAAVADMSEFEFPLDTVWETDSISTGAAVWQKMTGSFYLPETISDVRIDVTLKDVDGWVAFDDFELKRVTKSGSTLMVFPDPGFELGQWTAVPDGAFPATALWRGGDGPAAPHGGSYSYLMGNVATVELTSPLLSVTGGDALELTANLKGLGQSGEGDGFAVQVLQYDEGRLRAETAVWETASLNLAGWEAIEGEVSLEGGMTHAAVRLRFAYASGSLDVDDVCLALDGAPTCWDMSAAWTETIDGNLPAGAALIQREGGDPENDYQTLTNGGGGQAMSGEVALVPNQRYRLSAWFRGQSDWGDKDLNAVIYDSGGGIIQLLPLWGGSGLSDLDWQQASAEFDAPANAAALRVVLAAPLLNGWLATDAFLLTTLSQPVPTLPGAAYDLSALVDGDVTSPIGQQGAGLGVFHYDGSGLMAAAHTAWVSTDYQPGAPQLQGGEFTAPLLPADQAFRVGLTINFDNDGTDSWVQFEDVALTAWSQPFDVYGERYEFSALVSGGMTPPAGEVGGRLVAEQYDDDGETLLDGIVVWETAGYNQATPVREGGPFTVTPTGTLRLGMETHLSYGRMTFDDPTLLALSAPIPAAAGDDFSVSADVSGSFDAPAGQEGGRLLVQFYDGGGGELSAPVELWASENLTTTATVGDAFTAPANAATMRLGLEVHPLYGGLSFDDIALTAYSQPVAVTANELHQLTFQLQGELDATGGDTGGRLFVAYSGGGEDELWSATTLAQPAWLTVTEGFTPPAGTVTLTLGMEVGLNNGWLGVQAGEMDVWLDAYAASRSTYALGGQLIATRVTGDPSGNDGLHYLHTDHLGSATAFSDTGGQLEGEITRYAPFGQYRSGGTSPILDRGFTGHFENRDVGLTYMGARFYIPSLGRFASADSIVPNPANPQSYNRYSYALGNPMTHT